MIDEQAALFDLPPKPSHDCVRNGPCRKCGATRPLGYPKAMFLEPVSLECVGCNHATVDELLNAYLNGNEETVIAVGRRHLGRPDWSPMKPRRARRR